MKAFRFRLEQALRWRSVQRDAEKTKVAAAAKRLSEVTSELEVQRSQLREAVTQLSPVTSGAALAFLGAFRDKTSRRIAELERAEAKARTEVDALTKALLEANRRVKLVENLKQTKRTEWQAAFDRELEAFASESFLGRLQSRERARSSGG